MRGDIIRQNEG